MTEYILTLWLMYGSDPLPGQRVLYPTLDACNRAADDWHARASAWLKRNPRLLALDITIVSRCDLAPMDLPNCLSKSPDRQSTCTYL